jgi:hypothetical protein
MRRTTYFLALPGLNAFSGRQLYVLHRESPQIAAHDNTDLNTLAQYDCDFSVKAIKGILLYPAALKGLRWRHACRNCMSMGCLYAETHLSEILMTFHPTLEQLDLDFHMHSDGFPPSQSPAWISVRSIDSRF